MLNNSELLTNSHILRKTQMLQKCNYANIAKHRIMLLPSSRPRWTNLD